MRKTLIPKTPAASSLKHNDVDFEIPSRVTFLGEALQPVVKNLRLAMTRRIKSSGHEMASFEDVAQHMHVIHQALSHLSPRIGALMGNVISDETAGMAEAYREAGRIEQVLSEFVDGYHLAKTSPANAETSEARNLLLGMYRHYIREICEWLEELVQAIANPASAIEKRGLSLTENVKLSIALNLTTPIEADKLHALAKRLQLEFESLIEPVTAPAVDHLVDHVTDSSATRGLTENRSPGIFETIAALAFSIGITKAVLGRRHD